MFGNFISFLWKDKINFISFWLVFFLLLLTPGESHYWQVNSFWQPSQVKAVAFSLPELSFYPANQTSKDFPEISAKAFFVFDPVSKVVLAAKNENMKLSPASTTKIMTALVSLENYQPNQILTVPDFKVVGQKAKLVSGEMMTSQNLIMALLIASANDAGEVLAMSFPGGRTAFVEQMNEKAKSLFLQNTHFANPTGIDEENHYSTALDLARLADYALANQTFSQIVSSPKVTVDSVDGRTTHLLSNINELLGQVPGVRGVKTGWTDGAGECLVTFVERDGRKMISVVLGSEDRFGETKEIIDWVFGNFVWQTPPVYSTHSGSTAGT